jgi:hypothetical protein
VQAYQLQPGAPFAFSLDVAIDVASKARVVRPLEFTTASAGRATFTLRLDREPATVTLDPDVRALFDGQLQRAAGGRP